MVIDYILEINLINVKKKWFYSLLIALSNQNRCQRGKKQRLSFMMSQVSKCDCHFCCSQQLQDIANRHIDANKAVNCFQLSLNIGSNNFRRIFSSHFTHKNSQERHRMHTPYADTDVLQTLCADSALRSRLPNVTCKYRRANFECIIDSLDICLSLTQLRVYYKLLLLKDSLV